MIFCVMSKESRLSQTSMSGLWSSFHHNQGQKSPWSRKTKKLKCLIRQCCSQLQGLNKAFKNIGKSLPLTREHARMSMSPDFVVVTVVKLNCNARHVSLLTCLPYHHCGEAFHKFSPQAGRHEAGERQT